VSHPLATPIFFGRVEFKQFEITRQPKQSGGFYRRHIPEQHTAVPSDFVINYGGTANVNISGSSAAYGVIYAPNANVSFSGGSNFYWSGSWRYDLESGVFVSPAPVR
jgi:hypothetical protein